MVQNNHDLTTWQQFRNFRSIEQLNFIFLPPYCCMVKQVWHRFWLQYGYRCWDRRRRPPEKISLSFSLGLITCGEAAFFASNFPRSWFKTSLLVVCSDMTHVMTKNIQLIEINIFMLKFSFYLNSKLKLLFISLHIAQCFVTSSQIGYDGHH